MAKGRFRISFRGRRCAAKKNGPCDVEGRLRKRQKEASRNEENDEWNPPPGIINQMKMWLAKQLRRALFCFPWRQRNSERKYCEMDYNDFSVTSTEVERLDLVSLYSVDKSPSPSTRFIKPGRYTTGGTSAGMTIPGAVTSPRIFRRARSYEDLPGMIVEDCDLKIIEQDGEIVLQRFITSVNPMVHPRRPLYRPVLIRRPVKFWCPLDITLESAENIQFDIPNCIWPDMFRVTFASDTFCNKISRENDELQDLSSVPSPVEFIDHLCSEALGEIHETVENLGEKTLSPMPIVLREHFHPGSFSPIILEEIAKDVATSPLPENNQCFMQDANLLEESCIDDMIAEILRDTEDLMPTTPPHIQQITAVEVQETDDKIADPNIKSTGDPIKETEDTAEKIITSRIDSPDLQGAQNKIAALSTENTDKPVKESEDTTAKIITSSIDSIDCDVDDLEDMIAEIFRNTEGLI